MPRFPTETHRFMAKVEITDGCWLWTACCHRLGYGQFQVGGRSVQAHRYAYELLRGPIPEGLTLDHLCRVRHCVRPDHLEAVSQRENVLRGTSPSAKAAAKTHCKRGHPFDEANTRRNPNGSRTCRACKRATGQGGVSPTALNAAKTHCVNGHPFDVENTYHHPSGQRVCRACRRARYHAKRRANQS